MSDLATLARQVRQCGVALLAVSAVSAVLLGAPPSCSAEAVKCQRSILKRGDTLARARAKVLRQCEEKKRTGKLPPGTACATEPKTAEKIAKAEAKLAARIAKDCGGKDKICGTADDDAIASFGWPAQCPDFAAAGCAHAISSCADVAACVGCVHGTVVDRAVTLAYGALTSTDKRQQRKLHKCQGAIGAEVVKLHAKQAKSFGRCWDQRYKGKHANVCPDPGDGKAAPSLAKARAKLVAKVCKVCGGADKACGGADDFSPAEIGFVETCPALGSCGGPIGTLADLTTCLTCVADFGVGCALSLSVPGLVAYPGACAVVVPTPTVTPSATPSASTTPTVDPSASATPIVIGSVTPTPTIASSPTAAPTVTATATTSPSSTPTGTPTPIVAASATPTPAPTPCTVSNPGTATTLVTISLTTGQVIGAATLLLDYPPDLVRLPSAGGGAGVRARVNDLTGSELFDGGAPNNQDSNGDQVPDRVRLSLVSTTGVTGAVLAVELDHCDGAAATIPGDYACTLAHVVGIDGVTPIVGASCSATLVP